MTQQLLFALYLLNPDNTSVTVHAVSPCCRQHISYCSCCISLIQTVQQLLFMLYFLVPDNTSVHAVSPSSRQCNSYCSRCISLFQTTHTVHAVFPCSRQHISSCCISLFQTTQQLLFTLYLLASNPKVQDKAYEEVQSIAPEYPAPLTAHNINSMTYLRALSLIHISEPTRRS